MHATVYMGRCCERTLRSAVSLGMTAVCLGMTAPFIFFPPFIVLKSKTTIKEMEQKM